MSRRNRRIEQFVRRKSAFYSLLFLILFTLFAFSAELWCNNKPYIMKYEGRFFFPMVFNYSVEELKIEDFFVVDYKEVVKKLDGTKGEFALFPPFSWSPYEVDSSLGEFPAKPGNGHVFGTDDKGRDVFARLLYGYRISISFGAVCWFFTYLLGIFLGAIQGYFGGWVDYTGQRISEVISATPVLVIMILVVSIYGQNFFYLVALIILFRWTSISHYVRAEFLQIRKKEYVEAARAMGLSDMKIAFRHILPNALSPVITFTPFSISGYILYLNALDFLGFGLTPPTPSWGELLRQAQLHFQFAWWLILFPFIFLCGTLILINLTGEGIRDAFDPKLSGNSN